MSWTIGGLTLPQDPENVKVMYAKNIADVALFRTLPLLINFGPLTPVLTLTGQIAEAGKDKATLETDYILPIRAMVWKGLALSRIIVEDTQTSFWTAIGGSLSDDSVDFVKGKNCLKAIVANTTYLEIYHDYASNQDFSGQDFISIWIKGFNSGKTLRIHFWNEVYVSKANCYLYEITDNFTTWTRFVIRKSQFSNYANPTGWDKIRCVMLSSQQPDTEATWRFDRIVVGVGHYVNGPDSRHDGVYMVKEFAIEERGGFMRNFPFVLTLWSQDDYY